MFTNVFQHPIYYGNQNVLTDGTFYTLPFKTVWLPLQKLVCFDVKPKHGQLLRTVGTQIYTRRKALANTYHTSDHNYR